jgi:hypothetical protein
MEKVTKMDNFKAIYNILADGGYTNLAEVMKHEMDLLAKKNAHRSNKPTKSASATAELAEKVLELMEQDTRYTATDLVKVIGDADITNQRMTAALNVLVNTGFVKNEKVKGKSLFYKA